MKWDQLLRQHGFGKVQAKEFMHRLTWSIDALLPFIYSLSICPISKLSEREKQAFEKELAATLLKINPKNRFVVSYNVTFGAIF